MDISGAIDILEHGQLGTWISLGSLTSLNKDSWAHGNLWAMDILEHGQLDTWISGAMDILEHGQLGT